MAGADLQAVLPAGDNAARETAFARVRASRDGGDHSLVAEAELAVRGSPRTAIIDDDGAATVRVADRRYGAGRFATRSIGVLRRAVADGAPAPTLSVLEGSPSSPTSGRSGPWRPSTRSSRSPRSQLP